MPCERHRDMRITSPCCPRCRVADLTARLREAEARVARLEETVKSQQEAIAAYIEDYPNKMLDDLSREGFFIRDQMAEKIRERAWSRTALEEE